MSWIFAMPFLALVALAFILPMIDPHTSTNDE